MPNKNKLRKPKLRARSIYQADFPNNKSIISINPMNPVCKMRLLLIFDSGAKDVFL